MLLQGLLLQDVSGAKLARPFHIIKHATRNKVLHTRLCFDISAVSEKGRGNGLSGPISHDIAILSLRYPISRDTFLRVVSTPQNGAMPFLGTWFQTGTSVRYPILQCIVR